MRTVQKLGGVLVVAGLGLLSLLPAGCGQKTDDTSQVGSTAPGSDPSGRQQRPQSSGGDPAAAHRSKANLRKIGLAMHAHLDSYKAFPAGLIDPRTGKLGLSWRVQILPFLDDPAAQVLHKQFKLDEPWDSEHNKKLVASIPTVFAPVHGQAPAGHTFYQGFATHYTAPQDKELPDTAQVPPIPGPVPFYDPRTRFPVTGAPAPGIGLLAPGPGINHFVDGTSNTFLVAEAGEAVPWTRPQDIPFRVEMGNPDPSKGKWPRLGGMFGGDFHVLFTDGSVLHIRKDPPADKLWTFISHADGRVNDFSVISSNAP